MNELTGEPAGEELLEARRDRRGEVGRREVVHAVRKVVGLTPTAATRGDSGHVDIGWRGPWWSMFGTRAVCGWSVCGVSPECRAVYTKQARREAEWLTATSGGDLRQRNMDGRWRNNARLSQSQRAEPRSTQQMRTTLQFDGPNHLGLWLNAHWVACAHLDQRDALEHLDLRLDAGRSCGFLQRRF